MTSMVCGSILGTQRSHFKPPITFFRPIRPYAAPPCGALKIMKNVILTKNSNFLKMLHIGQNDDIWPEIGS